MISWFLSQFTLPPDTTVSEDFSPKSFRYHPGLFKINKWSCCRNVSRALGCLVTTNWPERNNNYKSEYILITSLVISNWQHNRQQSRRKIPFRGNVSVRGARFEQNRSIAMQSCTWMKRNIVAPPRSSVCFVRRARNFCGKLSCNSPRRGMTFSMETGFFGHPPEPRKILCSFCVALIFVKGNYCRFFVLLGSRCVLSYFRKNGRNNRDV